MDILLDQHSGLISDDDEIGEMGGGEVIVESASATGLTVVTVEDEGESMVLDSGQVKGVVYLLLVVIKSIVIGVVYLLLVIGVVYLLLVVIKSIVMGVVYLLLVQ